MQHFIQEEVIIGQLDLKSISTVIAMKSSQFSDTTKFYFEIHFRGSGSPWILRAYTNVRKFNGEGWGHYTLPSA